MAKQPQTAITLRAAGQQGGQHDDDAQVGVATAVAVRDPANDPLDDRQIIDALYNEETARKIFTQYLKNDLPDDAGDIPLPFLYSLTAKAVAGGNYNPIELKRSLNQSLLMLYNKMKSSHESKHVLSGIVSIVVKSLLAAAALGFIAVEATMGWSGLVAIIGTAGVAIGGIVALAVFGSIGLAALIANTKSRYWLAAWGVAAVAWSGYLTARTASNDSFVIPVQEQIDVTGISSALRGVQLNAPAQAKPIKGKAVEAPIAQGGDLLSRYNALKDKVGVLERALAAAEKRVDTGIANDFLLGDKANLTASTTRTSRAERDKIRDELLPKAKAEFEAVRVSYLETLHGLDSYSRAQILVAMLFGIPFTVGPIGVGFILHGQEEKKSKADARKAKKTGLGRTVDFMETRDDTFREGVADHYLQGMVAWYTAIYVEAYKLRNNGAEPSAQDVLTKIVAAFGNDAERHKIPTDVSKECLAIIKEVNLQRGQQRWWKRSSNVTPSVP